MLGPELKELRFCGLGKHLEPKRNKSPISRGNHRRASMLSSGRLSGISILPIQHVLGSNSPTSQMDIPLSNIVGNLGYVDHFTLIICHDIVGEDRTWDFAPAVHLWDHFESFPSRLALSEGFVLAATSRSSVQTVEIRVVLQVVRTKNRQTVCDEVELTRRWKIRRLPLTSTISIEPIAIEKNMWKEWRWNSAKCPFQSGLTPFFAQAHPELDQFVDIQYSSAGDLVGYFRVLNERRAAGI
jgi:hypothetical protein